MLLPLGFWADEVATACVAYMSRNDIVGGSDAWNRKFGPLSCGSVSPLRLGCGPVAKLQRAGARLSAPDQVMGCPNVGRPKSPVNLALTTLAQHRAMKSRDDMSAVIKDLQRDHGLLAAFLEATDKIDWRALHKQVVIDATPEPAGVDAQQPTAAPQLREAVSATSFVFRRANLVRAS
jgi:hypothetical protein